PEGYLLNTYSYDGLATVDNGSGGRTSYVYGDHYEDHFQWLGFIFFITWRDAQPFRIYSVQNGAMAYTLTNVSFDITVEWDRYVTVDASPSSLLANADVITGSNLADYIVAYGGDDKITGRGGADQIFGGTGNDVYIVDEIDVVTENADEGIDE